MAFLPGNSRKGERARVISQAVCKFNAMTDRQQVTIRRNTPSTQCVHALMNLVDEASDQQFLAFNGDVAFVLKTKKNTDYRPAAHSGMSMMDDIRVPVNTTLNGISAGAGKDRQALQDAIVPLGIVEMDNRDNGESVFNVIFGGAVQVVNRYWEAISPGTYLYAYVCAEDEAEKIRGNDTYLNSGPPNSTRHGRVPLILKPVEPKQFTMEYIAHLSGKENTKGIAMNYLGKLRSAMVMLNKANGDLPSVIQAAGTAVSAQQFGENLAQINASAMDAVAGAVSAKKNFNEAFRDLMAILDQARSDIGRLCIAKVITGAPPGGDMVVMLGRYCI